MRGEGWILRGARNPAGYAVELRALMARTVLPTAVWCTTHVSEVIRGDRALRYKVLPANRQGEETSRESYALPALMRAEINASWCATTAPTKASGRRR